MEILKVSSIAKTCMNENEYNKFMVSLNNQQLNSARLIVEDKIEELSSSKNFAQTMRYSQLKKLDNIVTNEYINKIDVNGRTSI